MGRMLRGLALLAALACRASSPGPAEREGAEPGRRIRYSGTLVERRLVPRGALAAHLPVGAALPFPTTRRPNRPGLDVQVNDPAVDHSYDFSATSTPDVFFCGIQSEASLAVAGPLVVVTYNSTAGFAYAADPKKGYAATSGLAVGFSASADGGRTFRSGFFPPLPGGTSTYFDNAVDVDRHDRFYAAYLSDADAGGFGIAVSRSDDGGLTWGTPVPASLETPGILLDKMWLTVGPDPVLHGTDVVYVAWTNFKARSSALMIARSVDGGRTFSPPGNLFVPVASSSTGLEDDVFHPTLIVDAVTGRLYVAFVQRTSSATWVVRLVASDDGGATFSLQRPAVPGAPAPDIVPAVQPGHLGDCGDGYSVTLLHAGRDTRPAGSGTPRYEQSWWLGNQPFVAAHGDLVALAWASSTSPVPLDPASGSRVFLIVSRDRGATWSAPRVVHPERADDVHHVTPAVAIDAATRDLHVSYVVQHQDETLDVELATLREADGYGAFQTTRLTSRPSTIPPSNVAVSATTTRNYDAVGPCYSLGHYMHLRAVDGVAYAAWNDARNTVTHPVNSHDPLSGRTHSQPDVFFRAVRP